MTFLKNKTLNHSFLTGMEIQTLAAQNCTCDKKGVKQARFVAFSKNKINVAY